jgi:hypothetical protein
MLESGSLDRKKLHAHKLPGRTIYASLGFLLRKVASDFRHIIGVFLLIVVSCSAISIVAALQPEFLDTLAVVASTPWGIVTSLFANKGAENLISNVSGLFVYITFFVVSSYFLPSLEKSSRSLFLSTSIFPVAIIANIIWLILYPQIPALGTSGLCYAVGGVVFVLSIINIQLIKKRTEYTGKSKMLFQTAWMLNLILISIVFYDFFSQLSNLESCVSAGVNVFVHWMSFCIGASLAIFWCTIRKSQRQAYMQERKLSRWKEIVSGLTKSLKYVLIALRRPAPLFLILLTLNIVLGIFVSWHLRGLATLAPSSALQILSTIIEASVTVLSIFFALITFLFTQPHAWRRFSSAGELLWASSSFFVSIVTGLIEMIFIQPDQRVDLAAIVLPLWFLLASLGFLLMFIYGLHRAYFSST